MRVTQSVRSNSVSSTPPPDPSRRRIELRANGVGAQDDRNSARPMAVDRTVVDAIVILGSVDIVVGEIDR